jgi:hypothetical protein
MLPRSALTESFVDDLGRDLYVFNAPMFNSPDENMPSTQIDDASPENLRRLRIFSETLLENNKKQLDDICHILVSNRDRRDEDRNQDTISGKMRRYFDFFGDRETV